MRSELNRTARTNCIALVVEGKRQVGGFRAGGFWPIMRGMGLLMDVCYAVDGVCAVPFSLEIISTNREDAEEQGHRSASSPSEQGEEY